MFLLSRNANLDNSSLQTFGFPLPNVIGRHFRTNKNICKGLSLKETVTSKQTQKFNLKMAEVKITSLSSVVFIFLMKKVFPSGGQKKKRKKEGGQGGREMP